MFFSEDNTIDLKYKFIINNQEIEYTIQLELDKNLILESLNVNNNNILNRIGNNGTTSITERTTFNDLDNDVLLLREIYFNTKFRGNDTLKVKSILKKTM